MKTKQGLNNQNQLIAKNNKKVREQKRKINKLMDELGFIPENF